MRYSTITLKKRPDTNKYALKSQSNGIELRIFDILKKMTSIKNRVNQSDSSIFVKEQHQLGLATTQYFDECTLNWCNTSD